MTDNQTKILQSYIDDIKKMNEVFDPIRIEAIKFLEKCIEDENGFIAFEIIKQWKKAVWNGDITKVITRLASGEEGLFSTK